MILCNSPEVPKSGWKSVCTTDLGYGGGCADCEMCGQPGLRFVHTLRHEKYRDIEVGCDCSDKLTMDGKARHREDQIKRLARRRASWLKRKGRICPSTGNWVSSVNGKTVSIFDEGADSPRWSIQIVDSDTLDIREMRKAFTTIGEAKAAAFDELVKLMRWDQP